MAARTIATTTAPASAWESFILGILLLYKAYLYGWQNAGVQS